MHIIADFTAVRHLPSTILSTGTVMLRRTHFNTGVIVLVTGNDFVNKMASVFMNINQWKIKIVPTTADALSEIDALLLDEDDPPI